MSNQFKFFNSDESSFEYLHCVFNLAKMFEVRHKKCQFTQASLVCVQVKG